MGESRCGFLLLAALSSEQGQSVAGIETNRRSIITRLEREGWILKGGSKHDKYVHADKPGVFIVVPRHQELSRGVARQIAKLADWQ